MDVSGSYTLYVPRERVWQALLDPAVLRRVVPGCEELTQVEAGTYRGRVRVGIAAVKGTYEGTLRLTDLRPPADCTVTADGKGARGVIHGESTIHLDAADAGTTIVTYTGKAQLGGPIATVGTRVVGAAANMLIRSLFAALADILNETTSETGPAGGAIAVGGRSDDVHMPSAGVGTPPATLVGPPSSATITPLEPDGAERGSAELPKVDTSSHPAVNSSLAHKDPPRDAVIGLVRRLGLSDGSRESERKWSTRIVVYGLVMAAAVVTLIASRVARITRR